LEQLWWRSLVDVVRVEMNQKIQSKVGKATTRYGTCFSPI